MSLEHKFKGTEDPETKVEKTLKLVDKAVNGTKNDKRETPSAEKILEETPIQSSEVLGKYAKYEKAVIRLGRKNERTGLGNASDAVDEWVEKRNAANQAPDPKDAPPNNFVEVTIDNKVKNPKTAITKLFKDAENLGNRK